MRDDERERDARVETPVPTAEESWNRHVELRRLVDEIHRNRARPVRERQRPVPNVG